MKKGLLFIIPLSLTSLLSCGQKESKITFEDAVNQAEEYKKLVVDNKAKDVHVSGVVNSFDIDGDLKFYMQPINMKDLEIPEINLDLKDSKFSVAKQKLAEMDIPISLIQQYLPQTLLDDSPVAATILKTLPSIPLSKNILYVLDGFKLDMSGDSFKFEHDPYKTIETIYTKVGNKLKVTLSTEDTIKSIFEIVSRVTQNIEYEKVAKFPGSLSLTFNELGYVEELALSLKTLERLKVSEKEDDGTFTIDTDVNINIDFSLHIDRTYYKTVIVNFHAVEYEYSKDKNKIVKKSEIDTSSNLDNFKSLFTVQWYSDGTTEDNPLLAYDDPIAQTNYWSDRAPNIAFETDNYRVLVVPNHTVEKSTGEKPQYKFTPKYKILGACSNDSSILPENPCAISDSLSSISYNGLLISESNHEVLHETGVEVPFIKNVDSKKIDYTPEGATEATKIEAYGVADTYIPAKYIKDKNGQYVINIAVLKLPEAQKGE